MFIGYLDYTVLWAIDVPSDITALYLKFYTNWRGTHLRFSGSSKYGIKGGRWFWKEEFAPKIRFGRLSFPRIEAKDTFLTRLEDKMLVVLTELKGETVERRFKDKTIFRDRDAFLTRMTVYMEQLFADIEKNPFFQDKAIYMGFEGEIPMRLYLHRKDVVRVEVKNATVRNKEELRRALDELGISPDKYSLSGERKQGCLVLERNNKSLWDVFEQSNRRTGHYHAVDCSESEACQKIYDEFRSEVRLKNLPDYRPTEEDYEEVLFSTYVNNITRVSGNIPSDIACLYFKFFMDGGKAYMKFSGASKWEPEGDMQWSEDFVPQNLHIRFVSRACTDREAFLARVTTYLRRTIASGDSSFKDKAIFIGFDGEKPVRVV